MESAMLEMPKRVVQPFEANTLGALDATASGETVVIKRTDENVLRQLTESLDKQLLTVLDARTPQEFSDARQRVWENYFRARRALSDTMSVLVPKHLMAALRLATMERVAEDLKRSRNVLFSELIADQVEFSQWIINKIQCLCHEVVKAGEPRDLDADRKLNEDFYLYAAWGQFHYDCILEAMKFDRPIPEATQGTIRDGLRAWVNAVAIVEEALCLRLETPPDNTVQFFDGPWDEEDEELMNSSMRDLDAESPADV